MSNERIVKLEIGYLPEPGVSGPALFQTELTTVLTFNAYPETGSQGFEDSGTAIIEFIGCDSTKFGYPNDEAWRGIPRTSGLSYGVYEVFN